MQRYMNLIFSPANVINDYEKAIINAVTEVWPESNIIGCRFNLTNSWQNHLVYQLNIKKKFRNRQMVTTYIWSFVS